MKHATFKGGIHPSYNKHYTEKLPIEDMPAPKVVVIPMSQHIGAPAKPVVEVGQEVKMGQLIGEAGGFISANIHSSVSGVVTAIEPKTSSNGSKVTCVVIENDFKDTVHESVQPKDWTTMDKDAILQAIADAGVVGLGGATFPTRAKLVPSPDSVIDHMIINGAECEPYLTSDHALMREHAEKVVGGLKIMMKVLGQTKGYIGIEDNKEDAIQAIKAASDDSIEIYSLHTKYPQGGEKQLVNAITGREVPSGGLPAAVGCIIANSGTAAATYEALTTGMPLISRIVTVTGSGIKNPKVLRFRIGTPTKDILEYCGGLTDDCVKVVSGGPMMGFAQYDMDVPATKGTSGLLCMNAKDAAIEEPSACIRCAKCTHACPMHLMPLYISGYAEKGNVAMLEEYSALDCIECGSCAFVCPARRPLVSTIRLAKRLVQAERRKKQS
ncbi:MAG: electron transport complex subunit RsxC [Anaerofustis stercorihominis]|nr:electron transport complex subunit RsxC [Anaerofustis stercorihominis]